MFAGLLLTISIISGATSKPIMVSFGTRQGPIQPAEPSSTTLNPLAPRNPAPVYEKVDDIPNPNQYRPPTPNAYRKQINSYKPNPNLILGTPLDIKYSLSQDKHDLFAKKRQYEKTVGPNYRGPQEFGLQDYEIEKLKKSKGKKFYGNYKYQNIQKRVSRDGQNNFGNQNSQTQTNQKVQEKGNYKVFENQDYNNYNQQYNSNNNNNNKYIPAFGIVYSSGLRYYVPQFYSYQNEGENSVYDHNDYKYVQFQPINSSQ